MSQDKVVECCSVKPCDPTIIRNHFGTQPPKKARHWYGCLDCKNERLDCTCKLDYIERRYLLSHDGHKFKMLVHNLTQIFPAFNPDLAVEGGLPTKESVLAFPDKQGDKLKTWFPCCEADECHCEFPYQVYTYENRIIQLDYKGNQIYPFENSVFYQYPELLQDSPLQAVVRSQK